MVFVPGVSGAARVSASVKWRMSFLLTSESGEQTGWTHFAWPMVRKLAQDFGWQPSGTQPPEGWGAELEAIGPVAGWQTQERVEVETQVHRAQTQFPFFRRERFIGAQTLFEDFSMFGAFSGQKPFSIRRVGLE